MNNLQSDGWDLRDLKYVQLTPREFATWRLQRGDIVLNRTNSKELVGKSEVFDQEGDWVFASYLMRLRVDVQRALPAFVSAFLSTPAGRAQIDRESRQIIGMANINAEEIRLLRIPLPPIEYQEQLLDSLGQARKARKDLRLSADALLADLDNAVLEELRLAVPPADSRLAYGVRLRDGVRYRTDPHFHTPRYRELQRRLNPLMPARLGSLVQFSEERLDPSTGHGNTFRYIEIGGVSAETGEAIAVDTPRAEAPSRARMVVHSGDVLVSLTRPQRGSIALIDDSLDGSIASTGFAVLSVMEDAPVIASYLWAFLRSAAGRLQMLQRSSGGNYPAITEDELKEVAVPVPDLDMQTRIAAEVSHRRLKARSMRTESDALWEQAKREFEAALLGPQGHKE